MPTIQEIVIDPEFQVLPYEEKRKVFTSVDKDFVGLNPQEQDKVLSHFASGETPVSQIAKQSEQDLNVSPDATEKPSIAMDILNTVANPVSQAREAAKLLSETIPNIPESALNYLKGLASGLMPKKESYYVPGGEMVRGVANIATGATQKLIPGEQGKEKVFDTVIEHFKNRYGGVDNLRQTITKDPVGFTADLSAVLSLGGGIATKAGQVSGVTSLAEKGAKVVMAGRAIEPINMSIKMTKPLVKVAGSVASQIHGRFMTGAGSEATNQAFKGHKDFIDTLRGKISDQTVIDNSKNSLREMRNAEVIEYGKKFDALASSKKQISIEPVKRIAEHTADDLLNIKTIERVIKKDPKVSKIYDEFGRNIMAELPDGIQKVLDHTNQPLNTHQLGNVKKVFNVLNSWDDFTPKGVDFLKRKIDTFYIGSPDSRQYDKFINTVRNSVKGELVKNVNGYEKLTGNYSKFLDLEEEIQKALSLGNKAAMDTTLRKLLSTMRENFEYRKGLLEKLDNVSGGELLPQIAGLTMQSYLPKGLVGKLEMGGLGILAYVHGIDPVLGTALLMSSPRLSAEFLYLLGKTAKGMNKASSAIESPAGTTVRQAITQTEASRNTTDTDK